MKGLGGTLLTSAYLPASALNIHQNPRFEDSQTLVQLLIRENDRLMPDLIKRQTQDKGSRFYGGLPDSRGLHNPGGGAALIQRAASSFIEEESEYFRSPQLLEVMQKAIEFLLRTQHQDGTVDLLTTNFHSTPDLAFVVEPVCLAYTLLNKNQPDISKGLLDKIKTFLLKGGKALTVGGIHTPNHRWVVSMALSRLNVLFPNPKYATRVEEWLFEKIDIDPDGQYTERSTHVYSPLTDRCLITIARLLSKPELFDPVRKNLEMMLYYVHPNGEIATEASGRQDQYQTGTLQNYYYPYRYMALKDGNPVFSAMAQAIPQKLPFVSLLRNLPYFQEDIFLHQPLPKPKPLPTNYLKSFPHSKLVRIRRENIDATILADNPTFFTFQNGQAVLQGLRFASAFFGKGQFVGTTVKEANGSFILAQELRGPYYQPYPKDQLSGDGNWEKMPRSNRPQSEVQVLKSKVIIREAEKGFIISIDIQGTDHIPLAIELGFRHGGTFSGVRTVDGINDAYILDSDTGVYHYGQDRIEISKGQMAHSWTQLRGALPKLPAMSVYITGFTPFQTELRINA